MEGGVNSASTQRPVLHAILPLPIHAGARDCTLKGLRWSFTKGGFCRTPAGRRRRGTVRGSGAPHRSRTGHTCHHNGCRWATGAHPASSTFPGRIPARAGPPKLLLGPRRGPLGHAGFKGPLGAKKVPVLLQAGLPGPTARSRRGHPSASRREPEEPGSILRMRDWFLDRGAELDTRSCGPQTRVGWAAARKRLTPPFGA